MKARWQERALKALNPNTIMLIDEASLDRIYSPFVGYDEEKARQDLQAILSVLTGMKGVHCCINTNWPFLLDMVDVISLDAYGNAPEFLMHQAAARRFVERGGIIAWGIVPASDAVFGETAESLTARLESHFEQLAGYGIDHQALVKNCLITPTCGLGTADVDASMRVFEVTRGVSDLMRLRHGLGQ